MNALKIFCCRKKTLKSSKTVSRLQKRQTEKKIKALSCKKSDSMTTFLDLFRGFLGGPVFDKDSEDGLESGERWGGRRGAAKGQRMNQPQVTAVRNKTSVNAESGELWRCSMVL